MMKYTDLEWNSSEYLDLMQLKEDYLGGKAPTPKNFPVVHVPLKYR